MVTIPSNLQCILKKGYSLTIPPAKNYLGKNSDMNKYPVAVVSIYLKDEATKNDFWNFWKNDINYGSDSFIMPLNIFGYERDLTVTASDAKETRIGNEASSVTFKMSILNIESV